MADVGDEIESAKNTGKTSKSSVISFHRFENHKKIPIL